MGKLKRYEKPLKTNMVKWIVNHPDCDILVSHINYDSYDVEIIAYAPMHSNELLGLREQYSGSVIMGGISSEEANCID